MTLQSSIKEIMSSNVVFVHYNDPLKKVESIMKKRHIRHLPVIKEGELVGMVSLTDLQRLSFTANLSLSSSEDELPLYEMIALDQVMVNNPKTIKESSTIKEVAQILCDHEFHALPVVEEGILVGMVSTTDLMKYILNTYDHH